MGLVTWSQSDQIVVSTDGSATLTRFANYSKHVLKKSNPYDNAQLLTGIDLANKAGKTYIEDDKVVED